MSNKRTGVSVFGILVSSVIEECASAWRRMGEISPVTPDPALQSEYRKHKTLYELFLRILAGESKLDKEAWTSIINNIDKGRRR